MTRQVSAVLGIVVGCTLDKISRSASRMSKSRPILYGGHSLEPRGISLVTSVIRDWREVIQVSTEHRWRDFSWKTCYLIWCSYHCRPACDGAALLNVRIILSKGKSPGLQAKCQRSVGRECSEVEAGLPKQRLKTSYVHDTHPRPLWARRSTSEVGWCKRCGFKNQAGLEAEARISKRCGAQADDIADPKSSWGGRFVTELNILWWVPWVPSGAGIQYLESTAIRLNSHQPKKKIPILNMAPYSVLKISVLVSCHFGFPNELWFQYLGDQISVLHSSNDGVKIVSLLKASR